MSVKVGPSKYCKKSCVGWVDIDVTSIDGCLCECKSSRINAGKIRNAAVTMCGRECRYSESYYHPLTKCDDCDHEDCQCCFGKYAVIGYTGCCSCGIKKTDV